jgi:hypothetical protein
MNLTTYNGFIPFGQSGKSNRMKIIDRKTAVNSIYATEAVHCSADSFLFRNRQLRQA